MYLDPSSILDLEILDFEHQLGDFYTDDDQHLFVVAYDNIDHPMFAFQHGFGYSLSLQHVETMINAHQFGELLEFGHIYV